MRQVAILAVVVGLTSSGVHAQRSSEPGLFGVRLNVEGATVKGAPYSAEVINESVQILSDGNRIVRKTTSRVYRDSEGRTRREEDRPSGSPSVNIADPVAGTAWVLNADTRTARQSQALALRPYNAIALSNADVLFLNGQLTSFVARGGAFGRGGPGSEQRTEEKLTARVIEGVRVEGTRRTTTIAAGAIGNERPIVVTSDEWTSPELNVLVLSESNDPRTGTSTYKLVNVKRGDPPASLFQVPADYAIVPSADGRGGARGGARSGGPDWTVSPGTPAPR